MAKITELVCDRCGRSTPATEVRSDVVIHVMVEGDQTHAIEHVHDLCTSCLDQLRNIILNFLALGKKHDGTSQQGNRQRTGDASPSSSGDLVQER